MRLILHRLRRLAASGSPVLFTGTVALAGLAISSIAKDVQLNGIILSALSVVLAVLLGFQMNAEYRRRTYDPTWMLKFDDDFNSEDMRRRRSKAATDLRDHRTRLGNEDFKSAPLSDVLDFFEGVGFLMQGDEITPEVAHHAFYYWIDGYCSTAQQYIQAIRKKDPTRWECVEGLLELTTEVEEERLKQLGRKREALGVTGVAEFLEEEIALAD